MKVLQDAIENLNRSMTVQKFPLCFENQKQYNKWLTHEVEANTVPIRRFICRDCSPEYKQRMVQESRCVNSEVNMEKVFK